MRRILHVVPGLNEGDNGIAVAAKLIAAEQSKSGDEAEVIDTRGFVSSSVQPSTFDLQPLSAYAEIWVHSMWLPMTLKACWKVVRAGAPLVRMTHANLDPLRYRYHGWKKRLVAPIERWLFKHTDRVVVTCEAEKTWCQQWGIGNEFEILDLKKYFQLDNVRMFECSNAGNRGLHLSYRERAERKIEEWLEGVPRESFDRALERLIDEKCAAGEYLFRKEEERNAALAGAKDFFDRFSRRIVQLSDGRCVYFVPDVRAKTRNRDNATSWAEYAFHAVSNGGARIPEKGYNERWYNPHKAANFNLIEMTLKAEQCYVRLDPEPRYDTIMFDGGVAAGFAFQVVARLDQCGNMEANLTEVTFKASSKKAKKAPRLVALAEAVQAVVHHQTTPGSCPQDKSIIPNPQMPRKGLHLLYLGRRHPLKGVEFLERAVEELNQSFGHSEHSNTRTLELRIVSGHFGEELEKDWFWCDVLVLPTLSENFGLVVAEALERGKRVITTDGAPVWEGQPGVIYLKGYCDGTVAERVRLLKDAIMRFVD